ncbi:ferric reductase-like transmembrane domain-containing protein [Halobacillus salinarum]|uniref:Ferric reductase-like transmembrane domain-containing protein n=1 Tax=Halobacillus salinarum TaxID=2932257 RepID=A0ABY4EK52_9BACI|nr:ferric reductase-like transmembrane domain-containing protein [Halobacillus salinarum]UOQ44554.1 ferric reductase-like transmembrane domain-containing protein [Halobacillus salinarum]
MDITTWEWTRISGLTSFCLLFFSIFAGLLHRSSFIAQKWKSYLYPFHQYAGWIGFLVIIFHATILLFDHYVSYHWYEVFIPFMSKSHRLLNGIGTTGLYGVFLILLSSDMMKRVGRSIWKKIHLFALPAYLLALVHGLFLGSDHTSSSIIGMYIVTSLLLVAAFIMKRRSFVLPQKGSHAVKEG